MYVVDRKNSEKTFENILFFSLFNKLFTKQQKQRIYFSFKWIKTVLDVCFSLTLIELDGLYFSRTYIFYMHTFCFRDDTLDRTHDSSYRHYRPSKAMVMVKSRKDSLMCDVHRYDHSIQFFSSRPLHFFNTKKKRIFITILHLKYQTRKI